MQDRSAFDAEMLKQLLLGRIAAAFGALAGYFDPARSAVYLGISLRTFDGGPAREIPCHRLTPNGKRLYKKEDLDAYMSRHRVAPASIEAVDKLVDDVLAQVRSIK